jgi:hypothetical protein
MKTILPLAISLAALNAVAQTEKPLPTAVPVPPPAPTAPNDVVAPAPVPTAARPAKPVKSKVAAVPGVMAQPVLPPPAPERGGGGGGFGGGNQNSSASVTVKKDRVWLDGDTYLPRSTKTGRTLVVKTSNPDAAAIADAEEDLSVMALILRKATGDARGDDKRMALGIEIDSTVFGSSSGARNIYVEGYGALFLLGVRFPLIAPPEKAEETAAKDEPGSDWAEAREEYLRGERNTFEVQLERVWAGVNQLRGDRLASEEYDADKVEDLKTGLLEALKNATHIRVLKPDEFVTVVIQGAEAARVDRTASRAGGNVNVKVTSSKRGGSKTGETVMTIRVKKSDVDAFAKGSLDLAGFKKKSSIQTYFRRGDASVATSPFLAPPVR